MKALILVMPASLLVACDDSAAGPPTGDFAVALSTCAPGVADICYRVSVFDGALDEAPFAQERACASAQSALADASFVLPCAASAAGASRIEVVVERLVIAGVDVQSSHEVPCRVPGECVTEARCAEGSTTEVAIPLRLVERDFVDRLEGVHPPFGFDDTPVEFEALWLSAKIDSTPDLLRDGSARAPTIVVGFVSLVGKPASVPDVYFSDVRIVCDSGHVSRFDPTVGEGSVQDALSFGYRNYHGVETGADSVPKVYWTLAIGVRVDEAGRLVAGDLGDCRLEAEASASLEPFARDADGWSISPGVPTRVVRYEVPVIEDGVLVRDAWHLDSNPHFDVACRAQGVLVTDYVVDAPSCHHRAPDGTFESCVERSSRPL